jgi:protein-S-isoprenylcysteine O-methyltransferase Ste14
MGLLASNWFIIITSLVALGLLMLRLPKEEAMLLKAFGDEYREYMKRTGALLPRLKS